MNNSASVAYQSLTDDPPEYPPNAPGQPQAEGEPTPETIRLNFRDDLMRSRPQGNAMVAATCTFVTAGMSIAFIICSSFNEAKSDSWNHLRVSWFIGAIIGSLVGLALVERLAKRVIYFLGIGLVTVNGICFKSAPENDSALILGLYCAGAGFGIILPAFIAAASEVSFKKSRGMNLSLEHVGMAVGMVVEVFFNASNTQEKANRAHGIFVLVCVSLSVISNLLCTVESPVHHLRKGNESEAINSLHRLVGCELGSSEVSDLLAEHKQFLAEDAMRETKTNFILGLKAYSKIAVLFVLSVMSLSPQVVTGFLAVSGALRNTPRFIYLFLFSRFIGTILGSFLLDTAGRRALTAFSLFAGGVLLIVFGTIFMDREGNTNDTIQQAQVAITLFELFAGIVATASTTYLGEAFAVSVKQYFVVASVCLECVIHIIFIYPCDIDSMQPFCFSIGAIQILFARYFFVTTNETKDTTLRQALSKLGKTGMIYR